MGIKITGIDELMVELRNAAERSGYGGRNALKQGANDIQELARDFAPVDEGNLEEAIVTGKYPDPTNHGRLVYTVFIDPTVSAKNGRVVGDYAEKMHEGFYNLGEKSEEKQSGSGLVVGRKFLERALNELHDEIKAKVEAGVFVGVGH